jgi:hypothetical protein
MIGNFQDGSVPGKMQFGSAWWFLDQLDGMEKQINSLSNMGLLSRFVGHVDRLAQLPVVLAPRVLPPLLCNMLGNDVERGLLPNDQRLLGPGQDVCFRNARRLLRVRGLTRRRPLPVIPVSVKSSAPIRQTGRPTWRAGRPHGGRGRKAETHAVASRRGDRAHGAGHPGLVGRHGKKGTCSPPPAGALAAREAHGRLDPAVSSRCGWWAPT